MRMKPPCGEKCREKTWTFSKPFNYGSCFCQEKQKLSVSRIISMDKDEEENTLHCCEMVESKDNNPFGWIISLFREVMLLCWRVTTAIWIWISLIGGQLLFNSNLNLLISLTVNCNNKCSWASNVYLSLDQVTSQKNNEVEHLEQQRFSSSQNTSKQYKKKVWNLNTDFWLFATLILYLFRG